MAVSKVKWGGDWLEALETDFDDESGGSGYQQYEGPRPGKGVYLAKVRMEQAVSSNDNDQVIVHFVLQGNWKPEHRRFDGYYWRDYLTFTPKTGFRTTPFLKVLGVTPREFANQTGADEESIIRQIGRKKFTDDFQLIVSIRPDTKNNPDYEQTRYIRQPNAEDVSSSGGSNGKAAPTDDALPDADEVPTPF